MIKDRFTVIRTKEEVDNLNLQYICINYNNGYCMKKNITCRFRILAACNEMGFYWDLKKVK